ncbi:amino acid adenylation domain-containing protein [Ensifer adhaerens]|uniref:Amino acid adenylation domain-containing protein n=1 Tax=Ensifer adhaerens TaxID=106592 RepID=A0ACC5ST64_ENSAD|nr:non-ribosomal peptide synthetase [Ensifer adhaerens]MBP1872068.1 amino acid adenylation domain-containing protein [Ensifer adhaerens]
MNEVRVPRPGHQAEASEGKVRRSQAKLHYDRDRPLQDYVRQHARAAPEATAIVFDDRSVSYGELDRLSDGFAAYLAAEGVGKGDIVCLFVPRSLDSVIAMLAILKTGGAYLPLDTTFPVEHLNYVIGECAPTMIFVDSCTSGTMQLVAGTHGRTADLKAAIEGLAVSETGQAPTVDVGGDDLAYVMYTSGSTGRPKGVAIPHRGIARLALDQSYVEISSADVVLHAATIAFDASTFEIWTALTNGASIAGLPDGTFSIGRLRDLIRDRAVTVSLITTGLFNLLADFASGPLPSLRHMLFGGEVASAEHVKRFQTAHPHCRLTNCYGPTEITVLASTFDIPAGFDGKDVAIGGAVNHTGILIVDDDHKPVTKGVEGELLLIGDGVAIGYFKRPELTVERFVTVETEGGTARGYLTGDLAVLDEHGVVIFKGRRDRQIKLNGKRIELDEIEAALRRDPRLADGVVICQDLSPQNKRIVGYLCPCEGITIARSELKRGVMERLRSTLPAYMIPSVVMVLDQLPLHQSGKVDRSRLPLPADTAAVDHIPVANRTEGLLAELWRNILGIQAVEPDRNFFDLGGTSLQLMRVQAALEMSLGRTIDVIALFQYPTIRDLARYIDGKAMIGARAIAAAERAALRRRTLSHLRRAEP